MPHVNFDGVQAKMDGGRPGIEAGGYVCRVVAVDWNAEKGYARMWLDVAEGEQAGFFRDEPFGDAGKASDNSIVLSASERALGFTKGRLETISADNPGFDACAAYYADQWPLFRGRLAGVVFRAEEYRDKQTGEVRVGRARADMVVPVADVRAGKWADVDVKRLRDGDAKQAAPQASAPQADAYAGEIPF